VFIRDLQTLDEIGEVTAPAPIEPGDLVATADDIFVIELVLPPIEARRRLVEPASQPGSTSNRISSCWP
jgi:hypothetical protein